MDILRELLTKRKVKSQQVRDGPFHHFSVLMKNIWGNQFTESEFNLTHSFRGSAPWLDEFIPQGLWGLLDSRRRVYIGKTCPHGQETGEQGVGQGLTISFKCMSPNVIRTSHWFSPVKESTTSCNGYQASNMWTFRICTRDKLSQPIW